MVDLAVQGRSETKSCPKCFAVVKASSEFCPECGATLDPASEGSDSEVYNELAKANLLRNRHQMQEAIEVGLGVLRKYPNNATAHTLLGDIYAELDDLKQAAEWYEMALDLSPESASDQLKLQKVRERMAQQQAATTARALGIPQSGSQVYIYIAVAIGLLLICSIGAFMLGKNGGAKPANPNQSPFVVQQDPGTPDPGGKKGGVDLPGGPLRVQDVTPDVNALTILQTQSTLGPRFLQAVDDPRESALFVTIRADGDELPEASAVSAAGEVFNRLPTYKKLTVRVVRARLIEYVGETTSDVFLEGSRRLANGTPEQIAKEVFSHTWAPTLVTKPTQPAPATPNNTGSTENPPAPTSPPNSGSTGGNTAPNGNANSGTGGAATDPNAGTSNTGAPGKTDAKQNPGPPTTPPPTFPTEGGGAGN